MRARGCRHLCGWQFCVLSGALLLLGRAEADPWVIEGVDCPREFSGMTNRCLQLDADGYPHFAYGENHLYHAWQDGTSWQYETADGYQGVGTSASIAVDGSGYPHVSYNDETNQVRRYTYKDASGWHTEVVDSGGGEGNILLDASGQPHVTYSCNGLKYAYRDGGSWHVELVDGAAGSGSLALAVDASTQPHIVYSSADLRYAYKDGSGWHFETIDAAGGSPTLAIDASGQPHAGYACLSPNNEVKYAYRDASGWHTETVDTAITSYARVPSLGLDGQGRPHLAYRHREWYYPVGWVGLVRYAYNDGSGWHTEATFGGGFETYWGFVSLDLDGAGFAHIGYLNDYNLGYMRCDASGSHYETVDSLGDVGSHSSLALDGCGYPHISYYDGTRADLKCAHKDGVGWHVETIGSYGGDVGKYSSIAIDDSGYAHISCSQRIEVGYQFWYHLNYFYSGGYYETPESYVGLPVQSSLAVDGSRQPHIAHNYYSYPYYHLRYIHKDAPQWHKETVDTHGRGIYAPSLALDSDYQPHISYTAGYTLRYARKDSSGWHIEAVDSGSVGQHTSLALDGSACPHISYYDYMSADLKYARRDASGWHMETVDSQGAGGSLTLDAWDRPHIGYHRYGVGLMYAHRDGSGWHFEAVDTAGGVGSWASLALDEAGCRHISYYDANNDDLKYAYATPPSMMILSGSLQAGQLVLTWTPFPGTSAYSVYGADNEAYFLPGFAPGYQHRLAVLSPLFQTWSSGNGIGDPISNWTYLVLAVDATEQELCRSNRVGEWDVATAVESWGD